MQQASAAFANFAYSFAKRVLWTAQLEAPLKASVSLSALRSNMLSASICLYLCYYTYITERPRESSRAQKMIRKKKHTTHIMIHSKGHSSLQFMFEALRTNLPACPSAARRTSARLKCAVPTAHNCPPAQRKPAFSTFESVSTALLLCFYYPSNTILLLHFVTTSSELIKRTKKNECRLIFTYIWILRKYYIYSTYLHILHHKQA